MQFLRTRVVKASKQRKRLEMSVNDAILQESSLLIRRYHAGVWQGRPLPGEMPNEVPEKALNMALKEMLKEAPEGPQIGTYRAWVL